ncbi:MAG TPA: (d)CMP kinase, partial [Lacunisphaera sp.]
MGSSPFIIVAIDGGAASGKSSSSRLLAERFNLLHVDTGSFYRHITAELLQRNIPATDHAALAGALAGLQFSTRLDGRSARMLIGGQPAGDEIRSQSVNEHVAHYAAVPAVREKLVGYQRDQADVAKQH